MEGRDRLVRKNSYITNELDKRNTPKSKVLMESFANYNEIHIDESITLFQLVLC